MASHLLLVRVAALEGGEDRTGALVEVIKGECAGRSTAPTRDLQLLGALHFNRTRQIRIQFLYLRRQDRLESELDRINYLLCLLYFFLQAAFSGFLRLLVGAKKARVLICQPLAQGFGHLEQSIAIGVGSSAFDPLCRLSSESLVVQFQL